MIHVPSSSRDAKLSTENWGVSWTTDDYIRAHLAVKDSGSHNYEFCKIPVPTIIWFDRLEQSLGDLATSKDLRTLNLLKYGMPIDCKPGYGIKKAQRNHCSAESFRNEVSNYFKEGVKSQALIGPLIKLQ